MKFINVSLFYSCKCAIQALESMTAASRGQSANLLQQSTVLPVLRRSAFPPGVPLFASALLACSQQVATGSRQLSLKPASLSRLGLPASWFAPPGQS